MTKIAERIEQTEAVLKSGFGIELHSEIEEQLRKSTVPIIQTSIERFLQEELSTHIETQKNKGVSTSDLYRSGSFKRELTTAYGHIDDLSVPKLRKGNKEREWQVLKRNNSLMPLLIGKLMYVYVLGLSLRDLQEFLYILMDKMLDKNTINTITLELQTKVASIRNATITESASVLIVDGVWVNLCIPTGKTYIDKSGHERNEVKMEERVILACIGVKKDGSYGLIGYQIANTENESNWNSFFENMTNRGLNADSVELLVSDGSKGILGSTNKNFKNATLQRCINHKADNISLYLNYNKIKEDINKPENNFDLNKEKQKSIYRNEIIGHAKNIFLAEDLAEAEMRLKDWSEKWGKEQEKAVSVFNKGINRCFEFYKFEPELHKLIRASNLIERSFREFRTRSNEMGVFPNELSCLTVLHIAINRFHIKNNEIWIDFAKT